MTETKKIPIVLLHYNDPNGLLKCVNSILERTLYPYQLYIVDNNSPKTEMLKKFLKD